MGSKRTKEDDVLKISTSVFVTNFPEQASAKDLWNACKQYGHVVDAFIPNKRSKLGRDFGFVRFIKVFDVERLVGNLCTVWIGRHRIHANAARFHRPKGSTSSHQPAMKGKIRDSSIGNTKDNGHRDDVKEVGVLENLKVALGNEGFTDIDLRYMGGLWVMIAFDSVEAKEKFLLSTGVCSWFSQLIQASSEFITDERVTMVEIKGIPLKVWNENTFIRIASKWGTLLNVENLEKENYHCKRLCVLTKMIEDEECEEVFKKDFGESDEEVQGENDVSRVSDTEVEEENPKSKDGVVSSEQNGLSINIKHESSSKCWEQICLGLNLGMRSVAYKIGLDRLFKMEVKTLSIGGQFNPSQAVLGSMPIYKMSYSSYSWRRWENMIAGFQGGYKSIGECILKRLETLKDKGFMRGSEEVCLMWLLNVTWGILTSVFLIVLLMQSGTRSVDGYFDDFVEGVVLGLSAGRWDEGNIPHLAEPELEANSEIEAEMEAVRWKLELRQEQIQARTNSVTFCIQDLNVKLKDAMLTHSCLDTEAFRRAQ
ncbi:nucleotide-binding alpha-beta plait domain-containing protein [Tanacetum coccineum]